MPDSEFMWEAIEPSTPGYIEWDWEPKDPF